MKLAELSRLSLKAKIQCSAIKFCKHMLSSNNALIKKVYYAIVDTNSWTKKIIDNINKLGFSQIQ